MGLESHLLLAFVITVIPRNEVKVLHLHGLQKFLVLEYLIFMHNFFGIIYNCSNSPMSYLLILITW